MIIVPIRKFRRIAEKHELSLRFVKRNVLVALRNAFFAAIFRILVGILKRIGKDGLQSRVLRKFLEELFSFNPLKWAFLVGSLSCFSLLKRVVRVFGEHFCITDKGSAALSGFLCALPVLVMNRETKTELCLYVFVRALHTFFSGHVLPHFPGALRSFEHYDILVMCLSASQILYSFVFAPFSMPFSYRHFLRKAAMLDDRVVRGVAGLTRYQITPELVEVCMERGFALPRNPKEHIKIGCVFTHQGKSCNRYFVSFFCKSFFQVGIPLYLPLKTLSVAAFQWKVLKKQPLKMVKKMFFSVISSALFLAIYSASPIRLFCFAAQENLRAGSLFACLCSPVGIAAFLEPKSRRMDLALYCLAYAFRSFIITQYRLGRIPYPRHFVVFLVYLVSVGFIFFEYDQMPDKLHFRMRSLLGKLLEGEKPPSEEVKKNEDNEISLTI